MGLQEFTRIKTACGGISGINKMFYRPILRATVGIQSLALAGEAIKLVPKKVKKPIKQKKLIRRFTNILVGTALLKPTVKLVESF